MIKPPIFGCPNQLRALKAVNYAITDRRAVVLTGKPMSGKSTVVRQLSNVKRMPPWKTFVLESCAAASHYSLQGAVAAALGFPFEVGNLSKTKFLDIVADLFCGEFEPVLIIDDIDLLLRLKFDDEWDVPVFFGVILDRFETLRLLGASGTVCDTRIIVSGATSPIELFPAAEISEWTNSALLRDFLAKLTRYYGLDPLFLTDDKVISSLLMRTQGATGNIVELIKALALRNGSHQLLKLRTSDIDAIWRF